MIKKDTIEYKIVSLIGLAGEVQTEDLYRLKHGKEYIRKTICRLNSDDYIKVCKYDGIKCLRLTTKCKNYLKQNYPERFSDCFIGASSTNKIRNDIHRRTRYHRLGKILVLLYLADVKIFADEKSLAKNTLGFTRADGADFADYSADKKTAEFYTSAELKAEGLFMNARTSRALGIIYSHPDVYIIYNIADGIFKWENKTEESFFYRAKQTFLWEMLKNHYQSPKLIFAGNNMNTVKYILEAKNTGIKKIFGGKSNYDEIFFMDTSTDGEKQLKYLINGIYREDINRRINENFSADGRYSRYYSKTPDGTIVVNCTACNIPAMEYVKEISLKNGETAYVIYFQFQETCLEVYFGTDENVKYFKLELSDPQKE